jgi:hypothetical protein
MKTRLVSLGARLASGQPFGAIHAPAAIAEAIPQTLHEPRARASMARGYP